MSGPELDTARHTPGPWTTYAVDYGCEIRERRSFGTGKVIARMITSPDGEWEANARLIAAAPDLLASLKQLEGRISAMRAADQGGIDRMPVPKFLAEARAAIEKAERGQP